MTYTYADKPNKWIKTHENVYVNTFMVERFRIVEGQDWIVLADTLDGSIDIYHFSTKKEAQEYLDDLMFELGFEE